MTETTSMQCPKCSGHTLIEKTTKVAGLLLDRCNNCQGIWFDRNELQELLSADNLSPLNIPEYAEVDAHSSCPRCQKPLYEFCYPGTITRVDACKQCRGIWLDNNEWKFINTALKQKLEFSCPKCHSWQQQSDQCVNCGVYFAKLKSPVPTRNAKPVDKDCSEKHYQAQSYADDIPGAKGSMLRFIDRAINTLTDY